MRKLNITRKKSFVASLGTMKIYIEDPAGERDICGYTCKKLGEIKNGETQSFDITENASRVFVIADNTSKNYCCDMQNIPEGNEDITLSGENKLNLLNGNAFRFDGETNEEIEAVRKKGTKKGLGLILGGAIAGIIIALFISGLVSNTIKQNADKVFSGDGLSITLNGSFSEKELAGYNMSFISSKTLVLVLKNPFDSVDIGSSYTAEEYGEVIIQTNKGNHKGELDFIEGLPYFKYDYYNDSERTDFSYFTVFLKGPDAYWTLQFCCKKSDYETKLPTFIKWAKSVEFTQ